MTVVGKRILITCIVMGIVVSCCKNTDSTNDNGLITTIMQYIRYGKSLDVAHDKVIYNDILNELIKNHFYNKYLGSEANKLYNIYDDNMDTNAINTKKRAMTKRLAANRANLCTLYLGCADNYLCVRDYSG